MTAGRAANLFVAVCWVLGFGFTFFTFGPNLDRAILVGFWAVGLPLIGGAYLKGKEVPAIIGFWALVFVSFILWFVSLWGSGGSG